MKLENVYNSLMKEIVYAGEILVNILYTISDITRDLEYMPKRFRKGIQLLKGNCPGDTQCYVLSIGVVSYRYLSIRPV